MRLIEIKTRWYDSYWGHRSEPTRVIKLFGLTIAKWRLPR